MKTSWRIVEVPSPQGPMDAMVQSGFLIGQTRVRNSARQYICTLDAELFTDRAFLVVAFWEELTGVLIDQDGNRIDTTREIE